MGKSHGLETLFSDHNFSDFKWLGPKEIVVEQWERMKCMFGCSEYGQNASCPPNVPASVRNVLNHDLHVHHPKPWPWMSTARFGSLVFPSTSKQTISRQWTAMLF